MVLPIALNLKNVKALHFGRAKVNVGDSVVTERMKAGFTEEESKRFKARLEEELTQDKYQKLFDDMPDCVSLQVNSYFKEDSFKSMSRLRLPGKQVDWDPKTFVWDSYMVHSNSPNGGIGVGSSQSRKYSMDPLAYQDIPKFIKDAVKTAVDVALEHGFRHQEKWDDIL